LSVPNCTKEVIILATTTIKENGVFTDSTLKKATAMNTPLWILISRKMFIPMRIAETNHFTDGMHNNARRNKS